MDKILVTGGLGFIGSNFIRRILYLRRNVTVINLDNMSAEANPANLMDLRHEQRYHFVKGNIAEIKLISKIIKKVDTIVNFAAQTHVDRSIAEPQPFVDTNIIGTYRVLEAARKNNPEVRMLHVSTDEIYGDIESGSFDETDGLKPSNPYSATKAAADMLALAYYRTYGLHLSVTRCTNNFGPYQHPEKLIPKAIIRAIKNLAVPVYGKGNQVRDWIYVQDHCDALLQTLEKGKAGEIYNISAGNELPNLKIVELILNIMKKPMNLIEFVDDRPGHDIRYSLDSTKIQSQIGWSPKHNLTEALKDTVNWYMNNDKWWKPLATTKTLHPTPWKLKW
jgi:dTDP-glucose 4,6-dehydratase